MLTSKFNKSVAGIALLVGLCTSNAAIAFDSSQKAEIGEIVREYLMQNPEVMLEVQKALEAKQQKEAAEKATKALTENKEVIFSSKNQGYVGNKNGNVTVVEFFDYNCHYCQQAMKDMNNLIAGDKNLKFVMKELPILSEASVEAHRVSTAVYRLHPDQYQAFHNALLGTQGQKDGGQARQIAKGMGFDMKAIEAEAKKDDVVEAFRGVNQLATSLGINGTPSYVIGDEVVFGALGEDVLRSKIENVRKCGKTNCS